MTNYKTFVKCFCGKEHEVTLDDGFQVVDTHYSISHDSLQKTVAAIIDENGNRKCSECGKQLVYSFGPGATTGNFRHVIEKIVDKLALGYGHIRAPAAFSLGFILNTIVPLVIFRQTKHWSLVDRDYFITDGILSGILFAFLNYQFLLIRKEFGGLEGSLRRKDMGNFEFAFSFAYSPVVFPILCVLMVAFCVFQFTVLLREGSELPITAFSHVGWIILIPLIFQTVGGYFVILYKLVSFQQIFSDRQGIEILQEKAQMVLNRGKHILLVISSMFLIRSIIRLFTSSETYEKEMILAHLFVIVLVPALFIIGAMLIFWELRRRLFRCIVSPGATSTLTLLFEDLHNDQTKVTASGSSFRGTPSEIVLANEEKIRQEYFNIVEVATILSAVRSGNQSFEEGSNQQSLITSILRGELRERIITLGSDLFKTYIKDDIFRRFMNTVEDEKGRSLVRIYSEDPTIPWELMTFGSDKILCLDCGVVRVSSIMPAHSNPFSLVGDVLILGANPYNKYPQLEGTPYSNLSNVEKECNKIREIFKGIDVNVELLFGDKGPKAATQENLLRELETGKYQVFHFSGHSGPLKQKGDDRDNKDVDPKDYGLILEGDVVSAYEIIRTMRRLKHKPDLVFLNSCWSGNEKAVGRRLRGISHAFIEIGIPYIIGMRWFITDDGSVNLAEQFYGQLIHGQEIEEALRVARVNVGEKMNYKDPIWACPVLYSGVS